MQGNQNNEDRSTGGHPFTNRLINEKSPYLLQHAHNPVDWYPWSAEAFEKAKREDKPVFLSAGYATCHWCHVMAAESFEDLHIAQLLNRDFVAIKVDREERPDIDNVYMQAVTALSGRGGWPLSAFLTPEGKPFFGGTYFPSERQGDEPAFVEVLSAISQAWQDKKQDLAALAEQISNVLKNEAEKQPAPEKGLDNEIFSHACKQLVEAFDLKYGGFGDAPKFPAPDQLFFLLRYYQAERDHAGSRQKSTATADGASSNGPADDGATALSMVEITLQHMLAGGIYDHLGGGFHRYATDRAWRVPHFEKMLYDQALVGRAMLETYQVTRQTQYAQAAVETLDFMLKKLAAPEGAFYSALDADSVQPAASAQKGEKTQDAQHAQKSEGAYYLWTLAEVQTVLEELEAAVFSYAFGLTEDGNTSEQGLNVLAIEYNTEDIAAHFGLGQEEVTRLISQAKGKLAAIRSKRPAPACDDKILTDWNGLAIGTLAFASRVLKQAPTAVNYLAAAERATGFLFAKMFDQEQRLLHRYRDGEAGISGMLDDYAFLTYGLLELYEATLETVYLEKAFMLMEKTLQLFWDEEAGGFFLAAKSSQELFVAAKETYDGALPAGNSIAFYNLLRLGKLALNNEWLQKGEALAKKMSGQIYETPVAYTQFLSALYFILADIREIVIAEGQDKAKVEVILATISNHFFPFKVLVKRPAAGEELATLTALIPALSLQIPVREQTTVYICKNYACETPLTNLSATGTELDKKLD